MKINKLLLGLLLLVILAGLFFIFSPRSTLPQSIPTLPQTQSKGSTAAPSSPMLPSDSVKRQLPGGPYEPTDPRWAERQRKRELDHNADWKTPFSFYGKAIDQNGVPVEGAQVHLVWNDVSEAGSASLDVATDAAGLFSLKDKEGKRLVVSITKSGYYSAESNPSNQMTFEFADLSDAHYHEPDSTRPVLFVMRKIGNTEPLIHFQQTYYAPANGNEIDIGLQKGNQSDLKVVFTRGNKNPDGHFDWTASIQGVGGTGFVESQDPQEFIAPDGGYQNQINLIISTSNPDWKVIIQKQYYVHLQSGDYARIEADVSPSYSNNPSVRLTVTLNPSGSRNLEFDPNKQINK